MIPFAIETKKRDLEAKKVRKEGFLPAIVYGSGFENQKITLDEKEFNKLYKDAGTSNLVDLDIEGEKLKALIHDVQINPVSEKVIHIDFYKVDMKEKIKTEIPLEFVGETTLVVDQEGSFIANKDALEVECLPSDLIDHIDVDISHLTDFEQNIKVADIKVPTGIEVLTDMEEVVALVQPPRSEEELAELEEKPVEDVEKVEVEHEGEKVEEAGKSAEPAQEGETETKAEPTEENK